MSQINSVREDGQKSSVGALDKIRREYLKRLHEKTGRNVIAYYSGWLSKPAVAQLDINDEDKNGFMSAVHGLDKNLGLDLILHTPGGGVAATHSIVNYLHKMFKRDIRAIVPQIAMSAGTMMACACKSIVMGEHSNLGPIDPHLRNVPAYGVLEEFRQAIKEIKKDGAKVHVWAPILSQYRPTFLGQCNNAIKWTSEFVEQSLETVMFASETRARAKSKARSIRGKLSTFRGNKGHDRHWHIEDCAKIGLNIERLEDDQELQDLVLTVHHCYMHTLTNSAAFKIIENQNGSAFIKQLAVQAG